MNEFDSESVKGSSHQGLRRGIVVASVDDAVKVRDFLLKCLDGAPQNSLSSAAVVGVGMEEPHGSFPAPSAIDYVPNESKKQGYCSRNQSPKGNSICH